MNLTLLDYYSEDTSTLSNISHSFIQHQRKKGCNSLVLASEAPEGLLQGLWNIWGRGGVWDTNPHIVLAYAILIKGADYYRHIGLSPPKSLIFRRL